MQKQPDIEIFFFFFKVSNSSVFQHPDENHTTEATNSFPRTAASPEQRRGKEPTGNSVQQETVRKSYTAWITDFFKKDKQYCQKRERGGSVLSNSPNSAPCCSEAVGGRARRCQPQQPGRKLPISPTPRPPIHRDTKNSLRSPGPVRLQGSRKSLMPRGQLLAAAVLWFYCHNPTEYFSSSMTSYLFLFLSIYLSIYFALLLMGNHKFLALVSSPSKNNSEIFSYAMQLHRGLLSELLLVLQPASQQDALAPTAVTQNWCGWWSTGWWNRHNLLPHLSYGNTSRTGTNPWVKGRLVNWVA